MKEEEDNKNTKMTCVIETANNFETYKEIWLKIALESRQMYQKDHLRVLCT